MTEKKLSFEEALSALDEVVARLEKGECSLDEMLKLHEKGRKLADRCDELLDQYEKKITTLSKEETNEI